MWTRVVLSMVVFLRANGVSKSGPTKFWGSGSVRICETLSRPACWKRLAALPKVCQMLPCLHTTQATTKEGILLCSMHGRRTIGHFSPQSIFFYYHKLGIEKCNNSATYLNPPPSGNGRLMWGLRLEYIKDVVASPNTSTLLGTFCVVKLLIPLPNNLY